MNKWTEKSFKVAKEKGYLDNITDIYPINNTGEEDRVNKNQIIEIEKLIKSHKPKELILLLLKLDRFPFDEPYIGFVRHFKEALDHNPKTLKRIFDRLKQIGVKEIVKGINRPKSSSRKFGNYFSAWFSKQHKIVNVETLLKSNKGIYILEGGDKALAIFAKKYLKYDRKKGLDFVIKVNNTYIIGEAKFVSHSGGTQDKSVREVIHMVKGKKLPNVILVGVVDGVPWVASSTLSKSLHKLKENQHIMSALCFNEFLQNI